MQSSAAASSTVPQHVFVGALEGRRCCTASPTYEVCPKLVINFYLSGHQRFVIDGVEFCEGTGSPGDRPRVSMINIRQYSTLSFDAAEPGSDLRKVKTSVPLTWLEREIGTVSSCSPALRHFLATHLSHFVFEPTPDLVELAEQICRPPPHLTDELLTLYRKARGLEIMRLCCAALVAQHAESDRRPSLMNARQSERVRQYIMGNLSKSLTVEQIARESGTSASSLQRHFKQQYGMTVFEFIRRKRLEAARDALECRGVTVAQAAWIAGYLSHSSFITAFKKIYGACPSEMRA